MDQMLEDSLETVLNDNVSAIWCQFYDSLATLTNLCYTDPHFDYTLTGAGFSGDVPLLTYAYSENNKNLCVEQLSPQKQQVLCVHSHSLVLQDSSLQYKTKRPLLFYLGQVTSQGKVKLWMSARTHSHMLQGSFGMTFSEHSAQVLKDQSDTVKFHLSARAVLQAFKQQGTRILTSHKAVILDIPLEGNAVQKDETEDRNSPHQIHAFHSIPAFLCPEWPDCAKEFVIRKRNSGWPSRILITQIIDRGCHVIPSPGKDNSLEDCEWTFNFMDAEKKLFASMSPVQRKTYYIVTSLLYDKPAFKKYCSQQDLKYLLFWAFEQYPKKGEIPIRLTESVLNVLKQISSMFKNRNLPNYFIDDCNRFEHLKAAELESLTEQIEHIMHNLLPGILLESTKLPMQAFISQNHIHVNSLDEVHVQEQAKDWNFRLSLVLKSKLPERLWESFQETARFYVLSSHARLQRFTLDETMIIHREILRVVDDLAGASKEHALPFLDLIQNNLGMLYHAKALRITSKQEKAYYMGKSEELLRLTHCMDRSLGRVRLANFLLHRSQAAEAKELLETVIRNLSRSPIIWEESELDPDNTHLQALAKEKGEFAVRLWHMWDNKLFTHDIVYSRLLRPTAHESMAGCMRLAISPVLGENSVAIFSANFHASFLLALCHAAVRDQDEAKRILRNLERVCELEVMPDDNDKRNVSYFMILANCYEQLGCRDEAFLALHLCQALFPIRGPRNVAALKIWSMKYGETWRRMKEGVKVAVIVGLVSLAYTFLESHIALWK